MPALHAPSVRTSRLRSALGRARVATGPLTLTVPLAILVALATGCEEKRNYPVGFEAEAAKGAPAEGATVARPGASLGGSSGGSSGGASAAAAPFGAPRAGDAPPPTDAGASASAPTEEIVATPVVTTAEVVQELNLPPAPAVTVVEGEEPFKQAAKTARFEEFRRMSARFVQLRQQMLPYGRKLADGTATAEERRVHDRLQDASDQEFKRLNGYMWNDRWSEDDRAAMGWILFGGLQPAGPK